MRMSQQLVATRRESPADAVVPSHALLLRAGMLFPLAAGVFAYGTALVRVLRRIEEIVRGEMDAVGGQEVLMPSLLPQDLWESSGRWRRFAEVDRLMFTTVDRTGSAFGLGPTHEEAFAEVLGRLLTSYKQLPLLSYQVQTKFRDEPRPRFGLLRTREFVMKDAYSFDVDAQGMAASYARVREAYRRIFDRCGLDHVMVEADTGAMGGSASTEFVALSEVGEDTVVLYPDGSAANLEAASASIPPLADPDRVAARQVHTPGARTIDQVAASLDLPAARMVKTVLYQARRAGSDGLVAVLVRGDRQINETKLLNVLGAEAVELADDDAVRAATAADPGFAGPVGLDDDVRVLADQHATQVQGFACGANRTDHHLRDVWWGRDLPVPETADIDLVQEGDVDESGRQLQLRRGIEIGHIFQLGTRYSDALDVGVLDEHGSRHPVWMGSYGIGITRAAAAIVEQHHDEHGIVWPETVAPYDVAIVQIDVHDPVQSDLAEQAYDRLRHAGLQVVWDDRDVRAGVKFNDTDLIGVPRRIVVGRDAADGKVELSTRRHREPHALMLQDALDTLVSGTDSDVFP